MIGEIQFKISDVQKSLEKGEEYSIQIIGEEGQDHGKFVFFSFVEKKVKLVGELKDEVGELKIQLLKALEGLVTC